MARYQVLGGNRYVYRSAVWPQRTAKGAQLPRRQYKPNICATIIHATAEVGTNNDHNLVMVGGRIIGIYSYYSVDFRAGAIDFTARSSLGPLVHRFRDSWYFLPLARELAFSAVVGSNNSVSGHGSTGHRFVYHGAPDYPFIWKNGVRVIPCNR